MSDPADADRWWAPYGLGDVLRISDPSKTLYRQFGLDDVDLLTLVHPRTLAPWFRTAILKRHGIGSPGPNWRQRPGAFVIHQGRILAARRYRDSSERPDYVALAASGGFNGAGQHEGLEGHEVRSM